MRKNRIKIAKRLVALNFALKPIALCFESFAIGIYGEDFLNGACADIAHLPRTGFADNAHCLLGIGNFRFRVDYGISRRRCKIKMNHSQLAQTAESSLST